MGILFWAARHRMVARRDKGAARRRAGGGHTWRPVSELLHHGHFPNFSVFRSLYAETAECPKTLRLSQTRLNA